MKDISSVIENKIICLNCGHAVTCYSFDKDNGYFHCPSCDNIHWNVENIWIFLPDSHEHFQLLSAFVLKHKNQIEKQHLAFIEEKLTRLSVNEKRSWEDEDVEHWNDNYKQQEQSGRETADHCTYSRNIHLVKYIREDDFHGKLLVEIGAGSAETVRKLLPPGHHPYFYIPTDYSYEALKLLQRVLGFQPNIRYMQCLGNRLPFREESLDYIFSLGVLHHMPGKEMHIDEIMPKIRPNGLFLFYEGYDRNTLLSKLFFKYGKYIIEPRQSAHEERINRTALEAIMKKYKVVHYEHEYSPFLTLAIFVYQKLRINSMPLLSMILFIDQMVIHSVGKIFKTFSSGACFAVLRK